MKKRLNKLEEKIINYLKNYLKELETAEKSIKKNKKEWLYAKCDNIEHLQRGERLWEEVVLPKHKAHREKIFKNNYNNEKSLNENDTK